MPAAASVKNYNRRHALLLDLVEAFGAPGEDALGPLPAQQERLCRGVLLALVCWAAGLLALLLCAPSSWSADADLSYLQSRVFRVNNGNCVHLLMSSLTMMCGLMAHLPTTDTAVDRHPACHCVHMLTATLPITVRCRLASSQTSSSRSQRRPTSRPTRPSSCSPTASAGPRLRLATGC